MLVGSVGNKDLKVEEQLATWQHGASVAKQQGREGPGKPDSEGAT